MNGFYAVFHIINRGYMKLSKLFYDCLKVDYQDISGVDYAYKRDDSTLYLYFEDSDGRVDWLKNLDFPIRPYKRMGKIAWRAHRGFLRAWEKVVGVIKPLIEDKSVNTIIIVGYSHGGAIAVLCHEYAWYNRPDIKDNIFGYGFGAPRVLWGRIKCKERWKNFTVIKNVNDLVTRLPPWIFGYRHVGTLLKIGKRGKYSSIEAHLAQNMLKELIIYETTPPDAP